MKEVTIDNVRERIAELEMVHGHGELSLRGEFELACLRMLADSMGGVDDDVRNVVCLLENKEWAENCKNKVSGSRLESEITSLVGSVQQVPLVGEAEPSLNAMMRALDAFYADDNVPERAMLAAFRILLADVREKPALVVTDDIMEEINRWATDRCLVGRKHYTQQQNALIDAYIGLTEPKAPVVTDDRLLENLETRIRSLEIGERKGALSTQQETSLKAYRLAVQCLRSSASSDENATDNTAQQFEALATSGKSEHLLNAERIAREAQALSDRLSATSAVHNRVSGWSERQQKVIAYSLWRFSCAAYQKANHAAQTNNKDMFDRFIRDARCAEEIREEFTSVWVGKL